MENIYVSGFEGQTSTFPIQSSKINSFKISELKVLIRDRLGISLEHQRLLQATKQLEDIRAGKTMTFEDYGIRGGATIVLVTRIPGGYPSS